MVYRYAYCDVYNGCNRTADYALCASIYWKADQSICAKPACMDFAEDCIYWALGLRDHPVSVAMIVLNPLEAKLGSAYASMEARLILAAAHHVRYSDVFGVSLDAKELLMSVLRLYRKAKRIRKPRRKVTGAVVSVRNGRRVLLTGGGLARFKIPAQKPVCMVTLS